MRQFVSYDNKTYNIVSFYVDGVEAYREVYPPQANERVRCFRDRRPIRVECPTDRG